MNLFSFCFVGILSLLFPLCRPFLIDLRHWSYDGVGTFLPICRVCLCTRQNGVECVPRREGEKFKLREVSQTPIHFGTIFVLFPHFFLSFSVLLPRWADSLSFVNLSFSAFPLFATAPRVRQLHLHHCAIAAPISPSAFVPFHSLESVHLTDCRLMGRDNALPPALFRPLDKLRELSLPGNRLRTVRIEIAGTILDRLDLSRNRLCPSRTNPNDTFGIEWPPTRQLSLENANVLALNSTHWTFGEVEAEQQQLNISLKTVECHVPITESHWQALEQLRIGGNHALRLHPSVLSRLLTLHHLDFSDAASVPEEFFLKWTRHAETQWHHIVLRRAKIKAAAGADQPNLRQNQWTFCSAKLEWLDISEMGGIAEEGTTLRLDGCAKLKWLYADANALGEILIGDSGPAALLSLSARDNRLSRWPAGLLRSARSLSSVQLANNSIARLPPELFEQYTQLNSLDLSQNAFHHFHFGDSSHQQTSLMFLNLSQNRLRSVALPTLSSLTVLDLSDNILTEFASLGGLPSLEHLHLSGNTGIRLTIAAEHSALLRLHLANCSLKKIPDLSRLIALRELDLRANNLESVPGHWLPSRGVNALDVEGNALRELGWDWRAEQLAALRELRAVGNPWECACEFAPPVVKQLFTPQTQQTTKQRTIFCGGKCPRGNKHRKVENEHREAAEQQQNDSVPNPFVFFLPPFALIGATFVGISLLVRGSVKREWRRRSFVSSHFAYRRVQSDGEAI
ncbi:hypothetical protein niasHT_027633 [Heterodera trifolii]|uniref:Uncharacterized protein n=1 Tax=Heterodera trifolii TaxID=157864 RepID=A0ABD2K5C5_9BILA